MFPQTDVLSLMKVGALQAWFLDYTKYSCGSAGVLHTKFIVADSKSARHVEPFACFVVVSVHETGCH